MGYNRLKLLKTFPRFYYGTGGQRCLSFVKGRFTFVIRLGYFRGGGRGPKVTPNVFRPIDFKRNAELFSAAEHTGYAKRKFKVSTSGMCVLKPSVKLKSIKRTCAGNQYFFFLSSNRRFIAIILQSRNKTLAAQCDNPLHTITIYYAKPNLDLDVTIRIFSDFVVFNK